MVGPQSTRKRPQQTKRSLESCRHPVERPSYVLNTCQWPFAVPQTFQHRRTSPEGHSDKCYPHDKSSVGGLCPPRMEFQAAAQLPSWQHY